MTPSSVLLTIASSDDSTMAASRAWASSARLRSVMSCVKQRLWRNRSPSHSPLELMTTYLIGAVLAAQPRLVAADLLLVQEPAEDVVDDGAVGVELDDVAADVLLLRVAQELQLRPVAQRMVPSGPTQCRPTLAFSTKSRSSASLLRRAASAARAR